MKTQQYNLHFLGAFGLSGDHDRILFDDPVSGQSGIYLWAVPYVRGGLLVSYVGETSASFGRRMKDHMIQTVGGNYRISDPDLLQQGVDRILWNGLWRKGTRDRMPEYLQRLVEFAPTIQRLFALERVFVVPFHSERRLRQRIEAALADHIKTQPAPISSLLPEDIRYYARRKGKEPVRVHMRSDELIIGLPCDLEA